MPCIQLRKTQTCSKGITRKQDPLPAAMRPAAGTVPI